MAYLFIAENDECDLRVLHEELSPIGFDLIECFPVSCSGQPPALGISIPFKSLEHSDFRTKLIDVMTHLIVARKFTVTDLYTGEAVTDAQIETLPDQIDT